MCISYANSAVVSQLVTAAAGLRIPFFELCIQFVPRDKLVVHMLHVLNSLVAM